MVTIIAKDFLSTKLLKTKKVTDIAESVVSDSDNDEENKKWDKFDDLPEWMTSIVSRLNDYKQYLICSSALAKQHESYKPLLSELQQDFDVCVPNPLFGLNPDRSQSIIKEIHDNGMHYMNNYL